jgi:hypothetical protein
VAIIVAATALRGSLTTLVGHVAGAVDSAMSG